MGTDCYQILSQSGMGIENIDRVFFDYIPDKVFLLGSTKVLAA